MAERNVGNLTRREFLIKGGLAAGGFSLGVAVGSKLTEESLKRVPGVAEVLRREIQRLALVEGLKKRFGHLKALHPDTSPNVQLIWLGKGTFKGEYPVGMVKGVVGDWYYNINRYDVDSFLGAGLDASPYRLLLVPKQSSYKEYNFGETWLTVPRRDGTSEKAFIFNRTNAMRIKKGPDIEKDEGYIFPPLQELAETVKSFPLHLSASAEEKETWPNWQFAFIPKEYVPKHAYVFVGINFNFPEGVQVGWQMLDDSDLILRHVEMPKEAGLEVSGENLMVAIPQKVASLAVWFADRDGKLVGYGDIGNAPRR